MFVYFLLRARHGWLGLLFFGSVGAALAAPPAIDFSMRPAADAPLASSDGTVTLAWDELPPSHTVELQQSDSADFSRAQTRYAGADAGSVLTGLPEGVHHFRVRAVGPAGTTGPWSEALAVDVTFMARGKLFLLLGLGGVVVLMTIGAILFGITRPEPKRKLEPEVAQ